MQAWERRGLLQGQGEACWWLGSPMRPQASSLAPQKPVGGGAEAGTSGLGEPGLNRSSGPAWTTQTQKK